MRYALLVTVFIGLGLGLLIPVGAPQPAVPPPPPPPSAVMAAVTTIEPPRETVIEREGNGHFFALAEVNGELVRFVVDTGATTIALSTDDARRIGVRFSPAEFGVIGSGASGPVRGQVVRLDSVVLDGKRRSDLEAVVIEGAEISLLGQSYLQHYAVEMQGSLMRIR